jgi:hypothetical protein
MTRFLRSALALLALVHGSDAASSGDVGTCDIYAPFGKLKSWGRNPTTSQKNSRHMWWAQAPQWDTAHQTNGRNYYNLRPIRKNFYGSTKIATPTKWYPGKGVEVTLKVKNPNMKYRGLLLVALDSNNKRVGEWDTRFQSGSAQFWTPPVCGGKSALIHKDANLKDFSQHFYWKAPRSVGGNGKVKFIALVKQGAANTGSFYFSSSFTLSRGGTNPQTWFRGAKGQSCDQVCQSKRMSCDARAANLYSSKPADLVSHMIVSDFKCAQTYTDCSNLSPATQHYGGGKCWLRGTADDCRRQSKVLAPFSCSAKTTKINLGSRICPCRASNNLVLAPDPCDEMSCGENGQCEPGEGTCVCDDGYSGDFCQNGPGSTSCRDGVMNNGEEGIDCGGPCTVKCTPFQFLVGDWQTCDKPCGTGKQTRTVSCVTNDGTPAQLSECEALGETIHQPLLEQACNVQACSAYSWVYSPEWGACSHSCGPATQERSIRCLSSIGNVNVALQHCEDSATNTKPELSRPCANQPTCPALRWEALPSGLCKGDDTETVGKVELAATCVDVNNEPTGDQTLTGECAGLAYPAGITLVENPDGIVNGEYTKLYADCFLDTDGELRGAVWDTCEWDLCTSQCNGNSAAMLGETRRVVRCIDTSGLSGAVDASGAELRVQQDFGKIVDPVLCDPNTKPKSVLYGCNPQKCSDFNWMTTPWQQCKEDSNGKFSRSRTSHCHDADGNNALISDCEGVAPGPTLQEKCLPNVCQWDFLNMRKDKNALNSAPAGSSPAVGRLLPGLVAAIFGARTGSNVQMALGLLLMGATQSHAHNWLLSPGRSSFVANTLKTCNPRISAQPHVQVRAGQKFEMEWASGHGARTQTNSNAYNYFALVPASKESSLATYNHAQYDDYLNKAPSRGGSERYHRTINGITDSALAGGTPQSIYDGQITSGSRFISRDSDMFDTTQPGTRQWRYPASERNRDTRATWKTSQFDFLHVSKFHNFAHAPREHDVAEFIMPAGTPAGWYIMYWSWRGYYDCTDIQVVTTSVSNVYGRLLANAAPKMLRMDHCQFENIFSRWTPCEEIASNNAVPSNVDTCRNRAKCLGVNVMPVTHPPNVAFRNTPINIMTTRANCAEVVSAAKRKNNPSVRVAVGIRPKAPTDTGGTFTISEDPQDPVFYSTCYMKFFQRNFDASVPSLPKPPVKTYYRENMCITCAQKTAIENANLVPNWHPITSRCPALNEC